MSILTPVLKPIGKAIAKQAPDIATKAAKTAIDLTPKVADQSISSWGWLVNGVKTSESENIFDILKSNGADVLNDSDFTTPGLSSAVKNVYDELVGGDFSTVPYKVRVQTLQEAALDKSILDDIIAKHADQTEGVGRSWRSTGEEGSKPAGSAWDDYNTFEREHWATHGKGSGLYFMHNDQEWRLDLKNKKKQTFSQKNLAEKNKENAKLSETRAPGLSLTTLDPEQFEASGATRAGGVARHHATPAKIGEKAIHQYEKNLNPNWTPADGLSAEGKKFIKILQNKLDITLGDMLANYTDYPQIGRKSPLHTSAHEILNEKGMNPRTISFEGMSNDQIYQWFKNDFAPVKKQIDDELGFKSPYTVKSAGKAARDINKKRLSIKSRKKPRKKPKPTQFPEKIQDHITRSQEIGITEPGWKNGSIDYTWRPQTNTGQIDIPPQSKKGFKGLRDEFFEQIEDLPSGSVWELNPKFKDEKRRRIYARLFTGDPRITRNADETLGWVLTIP